MVVEEAYVFGHHNLLCARLRNVVADKRRRVPLQKKKGGCQNNTTFPVEYSHVGLEFEGRELSEGMGEARSAALWGH